MIIHNQKQSVTIYVFCNSYFSLEHQISINVTGFIFSHKLIRDSLMTSHYVVCSNSGTDLLHNLFNGMSRLFSIKPSYFVEKTRFERFSEMLFQSQKTNYYKAEKLLLVLR